MMDLAAAVLILLGAGAIYVLGYRAGRRSWWKLPYRPTKYSDR